MEGKKLEEYLKIVLELEKEKYTLEKIIDELKKQLNTNYSFNENPPYAPTQPIYSPPLFKKTYNIALIVYLICVPFLLWIPLFLGILFNRLMLVETNKNIDAYMVTIVISATIFIVFIVPIILGVSHNKQEKKRKKAMIEKYNYEFEQKIQWYNNALARFNAAKNEYDMGLYQFNLSQQNKKMELEKQLKKTKELNEKQSRLLKEYYSVGVIPEDFRDIVPISMFYQYIKNKQTYSIERNPNNNDPGAINMYKEEVRIYQLITSIHQLNYDIIQNMRMIQEHQRCLYETIEESRHDNEKYMSELKISLDRVRYQQQTTNSELQKNNILSDMQVRQTKYQNELLNWHIRGY